jgi:hypothetical protein
MICIKHAGGYNKPIISNESCRSKPDMTVQHIELGGERYVILPEREFDQMVRRHNDHQHPMANSPQSCPAAHEEASFPDITPLDIKGPPASELLLRDRR